MADDVVGSVSVNIVPSAQDFNRKAQAALNPQADELGKHLAGIIGNQVSQGIAKGVRDGLSGNGASTAAAASGRDSGRAFGSKFSDEVKLKVREALNNLPLANVGIDATEADQEIGRLRMDLHSLSAQVGVDVNDDDALARLDLLRIRIDELSSSHPSVTVDADTTAASAALADVIAHSDELGAHHPTVQVGVDSAHAEEQLAAVGAEAAALAHESPSIHVDADTAGADAQLAATGAEAAAVGAAASSASGSGGVGGLITAAIGLSPVLVAVGAVGVGAFAAIGAAAAAVGAGIGVALLALKPVIDAYQALSAEKKSAPRASNAAAVESANAQMASSERNLANTRANVADQAVQAAQKVKDAQQSLADAERSAAEQIKNAEQGVAQARAQAAQTAKADAKSVADAEAQAAATHKADLQSVVDAEAQAVTQHKADLEAVQAAEAAAMAKQKADLQALQTAKQQAAQANAQAEAQVVAAEQSLAQAQQQSVVAQQNLNLARKQAVKDLQQMAFSATDAALSQQQAQLSLEQAQQNYNQVMASKTSTSLQKREAALAVAQAKQALIEQRQAAKDAAAANKDAQKGGVEGDKNVVAAKKAVADANKNVIDQQKALLVAQKNVVTVQVAGAKSIADAQRKMSADAQASAVAVSKAQQKMVADQKSAAVAIAKAQSKMAADQKSAAQSIAAAEEKLVQDRVAGVLAVQRAEQGLSDAKYNGARSVNKAREGVSNAQSSQRSQGRQGANQVAQAKDAVAAAQRAQEQAGKSAGSTASASSKKVAEAMAALSPAGKDFLKYIMSIKSGFGDLSKTAQQGFLPGLEKGLKALSPLMKPITGLVSGVAKAMGGIAESAGKALGGPEGQKFVNFLSKNLPTWLTLVAKTAGHFMSGLIKLFEGFGPTATLFLGWFEKAAESFDKWTGTVTKSAGFKSFLAYIAKEGPVVGDFFKNLFVIIGKLAVGLAPLGALMMGLFDWLSKVLAKMSPNTLLLIAAAFAILWIAIGGGIVAVIIAIVAISAWLVNLYQQNETFRNIVNKVWAAVKAAWHGIMVAISATVNWITNTAWPAITGFFSNVKSGMSSVGSWFATRWHDIKSAFNNTIKWITGTAWPWLKGVFSDIKNGFKAVGKWFHDKWNDIRGFFSSAVNWIKGAWKREWGGLKEIFTHPIQAAKNVINNLLGAVGLRKPFAAVHQWVAGIFKREWNGLQKIFTHPIQTAKDVISKILGATGLRKVFANAVDSIGKVWGKIEGKISAPINAIKKVINHFIDAFNKVGGLVGLHIPHLATGGTVPVGHGGGHVAPVRGYAGGGVIQGPWRGAKADNVLGISAHGIPTARVNPGEYITNVAATRSMQRNHPGVLEHINSTGKLPNYAEGGLAGIIKTVGYALAQVGKPYVWGAAGPNAFDCSGLTSAAWKHGANVTIPHLAAAQHRQGWPISRSHLFPGDLVFPTVTAGGGIPHVEMYVGKGNVVEAMNPSLGIRGPHPMNGFAGGARRPALLAQATASNSGSVLGALGDAIAAAAKKGGSLLSGLGGAIFSPLKSWIGDHLGGLSKFAGPFAGKMLPGLAKKLASSAISKGVQTAESAFSFGSGGTSQAGVGGGVQRWAETIANALSMNKLPTTGRYVDAWLRQVKTESSGDPTATQGNIGDINNRTGQLARGLLQVVPSTFAAYKFPGHGNIFEALDNSLAAINYAKHRYGSTGMLDVIGHGHGYANGTSRAMAGIAGVAERGAELVMSPQMRNFRGGETVYTAGQTAKLMGAGSAADMRKAFRDGMNGSRMVLEVGGKRVLADVVIDEIENRVGAGVAGGI